MMFGPDRILVVVLFSMLSFHLVDSKRALMCSCTPQSLIVGVALLLLTLSPSHTWPIVA